MSDETPKKPLTPALQNPWYHLLTWYGEPEGLGDYQVISKNRLFWHRYMYEVLDDDHKKWLIEEKIHIEEELLSFSDEDKENIDKELENRLAENGGSGNSFSFENFWIRFSNVKFNNALYFISYIFPIPFNVSNSTFLGEVYFFKTKFSQWTEFNGSIFSEKTIFYRSTFLEDVSFSDSTYYKKVNFSGSTFGSSIIINQTNFENLVDFTLAKFDGVFSATDTTYEKLPFFSSLDGIIHPISLLNSIDHFIRSHNIVDQIENSEVQYYENTFSALKNKAIEVQKDRFALNIWALELQLERKLLKQKEKKDFRVRLNILAISAYESTADFGRSFVHPFYALLCLMLIGLLVQYGLQYIFYSPFGLEGWESLKIATSISVSNTFLFLTPWKVEGMALMNGWVKFFSLVQSVFSFAFIFLIGLGLRNRFKIR